MNFHPEVAVSAPCSGRYQFRNDEGKMRVIWQPPDSFEQWLAICRDSECINGWNAYQQEGKPIVDRVAERFKNEFENVEGIVDIGIGIDHGGAWVIRCNHRFVFNPKLIPEVFLGIRVKRLVSGELPREFEEARKMGGDVWAPSNFRAYVGRCADEIRNLIGSSTMTDEEILDFLSPYGTFAQWTKMHEEMARDCLDHS